MLDEPQCSIRKCIHFVGVKDDGSELSERVVCEAFPDGIPAKIAYGTNRHLSSFEGDNGIQFEQEE